ncbi:WecB/TagA/CpsF family glycosyltransferase [Desulfatiferula olefinivorans]
MTSNTDNSTILGYPTWVNGLEPIVDQIMETLPDRSRTRWVACLNPHSLVTADRSPLFRKALRAADILLPDGVGIVLAAKWLNGLRIKKIAGSDLFRAVNERADRNKGVRCFFLGSTPLVLARITRRMEADYPGMTVCGTYSPPFKETFSSEDDHGMLEAIHRAAPDILWVGMTAPKQELWIYKNLDRIQVPWACAIGAVFDFYAGTKQRSSEFWIRLGLEWLPRFLKEPGRLWERNMKSSPVFLFRVFREAVKSKG